ncbi:hypothetical protein [Streptomyces griseus]|uniref:hypothetical protein n=1 Tax=Streptomyces griseus TaxID=1911 RepID=UPI0004C64182|nr:hypothetical protein [Streptomyces griseus]
MTSTRRVLGALALLAALGGVTACGPEDAAGAAGDPAGGASAPSAPPAATAPTTPPVSATPDPAAPPAGAPTDDVDGDGKGGDCGDRPALPSGILMVKVALMRDAGGFEAAQAVPHCTPNDWIYGAEKDAPTRHYVLPETVDARLTTGPGAWKKVDHEQLALHVDRCLFQEIGAPSDDYPRVEPPFSCSGNVYEITLDTKGAVKTMKEIWHV